MNDIFITNDLEYSSTIHLSENSKDRNQFIYGSQSYETSYAIYAKFNVQPSNVTDHVTIKDIEYRIINYKGILNIGFHSEPFLSYDEKKRILHIGVEVIGASNNDFLVKNQNLEINKNCLQLSVNRKLIPLDGGDGSAQYHHGLFDSEFHYRDGNFIKKRKNFDDMTMLDSDILVKSKNETKILVPGIRCKQGISKIIF
jgi:hypothetical protein